MLLPVVYRVVYMAFMFVAQLMLANLLQPAGLGALSLLILNASFVTLLTGLGSDTMAIHALAQKKWTIDYGFSFLIKISGIQLLLFILMEWGSAVFTHVSLLSRGRNGWLAETLYFAGLVCTEKMLVLYYATHRAKLFNGLLLSSGLAYLIALVLLYFSKLKSIDPVLLVAVQSLLQGTLLTIIFLTGQKRLRILNIAWQHTFSTLRISMIVMVTNVAQLLAYRMDFWLLRHYYSDYEVGIYAQANKFAGLLWVLPNILGVLLVTRFSQMQKSSLPAVFRLANWLNVVLAGVTAVAAFMLYHYFLLPQYSAGFKAFLLMLPGYFCWALAIYFGAYFSWKGAFKINLLASSFCLLLIFIADLMLIPLHGVNGAAMANTIAYTGTLCLYLFIAGKYESMPVQSVYNFRRSDLLLFKKSLR